MQGKSIGILIFALIVALGGWFQTLPQWASAATPEYLGQGLAVVGGVGLAWLGKSPVKRGGGL
jgi:hypothetical protein